MQLLRMPETEVQSSKKPPGFPVKYMVKRKVIATVKNPILEIKITCAMNVHGGSEWTRKKVSEMKNDLYALLRSHTFNYDEITIK